MQIFTEQIAGYPYIRFSHAWRAIAWRWIQCNNGPRLGGKLRSFLSHSYTDSSNIECMLRSCTDSFAAQAGPLDMKKTHARHNQ